MTKGRFTESVVEEAALEWFRELGWTVLHGPEIASGGANAERADYHDPLLAGRLEVAIARLNPGASPEARDEALRRLTRLGGPSLIQANRAFHKLLVNGVAAEVVRDGETRGELVRLVDFDNAANSDLLVVNQYTIVGRTERRPDIVLFVNGLPLAVIELKNWADPKATIETAFTQLAEVYPAEIPQLFQTNELLVISDGGQTEIGCLTTPRERWAAWKTIDGENLTPNATLETAIKGIFPPATFLDLVRSFIVFQDDGAAVSKKVAQYH